MLFIFALAILHAKAKTAHLPSGQLLLFIFADGSVNHKHQRQTAVTAYLKTYASSLDTDVDFAWPEWLSQ